MRTREICIRLLVLSLTSAAIASSCLADLSRKNSPKGNYGTGTEIFASSPVPFTLSDGSSFTLQSRIRCVTSAPGDCLHANSVFPFFYVITIPPTGKPVTQQFTIQLTAPFDPQNSSSLNFGILDALDSDGFGTVIAACPAPADPTTQNPCIDPLLDASSNDNNGTLTFVVNPHALPSGSQALQPNDQIFLYATSFAPPNCPFDFTKGLACTSLGSLTGAISVSSSSGIPSPTSTMGLAPVLPTPGRKVGGAPSENVYFDPLQQLAGNSITAKFTPSGGAGSTVSNFLVSSVDTLNCFGCGGGPANVLYGYLYNLQMPAILPTLPATITVTLTGPFNQTNFPFLTFGVLGGLDPGTSSNITNCQGQTTPATYDACVDAIVKSAVLTPTSLTFTIDATQLSASDNLTLYATSNNSPNIKSCNTTTCPSVAAVALSGDSSVAVSIPSGATTVVGPSDPLPVPSLASLSPASANAGGPQFTLTANGSNFVTSSSIAFNNVSEPTTFVSTTKLTATIPASAIHNSGTASVVVSTPAPGGGTSTPALSFTIGKHRSFVFVVNDFSSRRDDLGRGGGSSSPTTTQLTVSSTKIAANGSITVSATVTGGTPDGNVQFFVDGNALGNPAPLMNGGTGNITVTATQAPNFLPLVGTH